MRIVTISTIPYRHTCSKTHATIHIGRGGGGGSGSGRKKICFCFLHVEQTKNGKLNYWMFFSAPHTFGQHGSHTLYAFVFDSHGIALSRNEYHPCLLHLPLPFRGSLEGFGFAIRKEPSCSSAPSLEWTRHSDACPPVKHRNVKWHCTVGGREGAGSGGEVWVLG